MNRISKFFHKSVRYLKKNGIKGIFTYIKRKLSFKSGKVNIPVIFDFIVNNDVVAFDQKDHDLHKNDDKLLLNWVIPEMGIGSGGHINIFRFVTMLEDMGFHSRIYLQNPVNLVDNKSLLKFTRTYFPLLDNRVELFCDTKYMTYAHATIATGWQTAYPVKNFNNTISKFYFVQDFEPHFFPHGSNYAFAENTYKFGFRGITAGDWLKTKLRDEYGMKTDSFSFSYDKSLYSQKKKTKSGNRVFFYARPVTPRRDFELGMLALNELSKRIDDLTVVFAGWDVSDYAIPFRHENLGIVSLDKLSGLYAECDLCFIISNTNLSLLPLEVMASGSVAVCSKGENSSWLVNEENSIMVDYDPIEIADTMAYYLQNKDELEKIRQKGIHFAQSTSWMNEGIKVRDALMKGIAEDEQV